MPNNINIAFTSENTVLLSWPEQIDDEQHKQIIWFQTQLEQLLGDLWLDSVASFNSLLIVYQLQYDALGIVKTTINHLIEQSASARNELDNSENGKAIEIPVYYSDESGWDLAQIANESGLTMADVITLHSSKTYRAYALGFTPGFCYLAKLNKALVFPRRSTPRTKVPAGAVAIAGQQTAVYPDATPGGWHILGQTPLVMYERTSTGLAPTIKVGDSVKFNAITKQEFIALGGQLEKE